LKEKMKNIHRKGKEVSFENKKVKEKKKEQSETGVIMLIMRKGDESQFGNSVEMYFERDFSIGLLR
jgi:hypothetical protein